jgi:hypothetical protein
MEKISRRAIPYLILRCIRERIFGYFILPWVRRLLLTVRQTYGEGEEILFPNSNVVGDGESDDDEGDGSWELSIDTYTTARPPHPDSLLSLGDVLFSRKKKGGRK